jgi:hypothetical protein
VLHGSTRAEPLAPGINGNLFNEGRITIPDHIANAVDSPL